jgi:hypothetical protein
MTDKERQRPVPPYLPWKTFENYVDGLKVFGDHLPNVIDRDSMRNLSGAMQSWLLSGLRSLNMIDENGSPKPRLKQIVQATPDARKGLYKQVIEAEYKFLDGINLQGATPKQIEAAFETTGATGDTVRKCIVFFVGLAKAADIKLSPLIQKVRRRPAKVNGAGKKDAAPKDVAPPTPRTPPGGALDSHQRVQEKPPYQVLYELLDPDMTPDEQNAIWTLLRYLKKEGRT